MRMLGIYPQQQTVVAMPQEEGRDVHAGVLPYLNSELFL